jgi:3-oxoadipate enol-lactonase
MRSGDIALPTGPRVAYRDSGSGRLAVVLAHGFMLDQSMFDAQVAALSPEYRVITWDARGHGATTDDGEPFTEWDNARDMFALLDHLGIDDAVVGGMSKGGYVSLCAPLLQPRRVRGLILISTTARGQEPGTIDDLLLLLQAWAQHGATEEHCRLLAAMVFGDGDVAPWIAKWKAHPREAFARPFRSVIERADLFDRLGEISAPTLIVHGSEDVGIPVPEARRHAQAIPGAGPVIVVDGAPHASNITHPAEVNAALTRFLSEL